MADDISRLNWFDLYTLAVRLTADRDVALNECCRLQHRRVVLVESVRDAMRELDRFTDRGRIVVEDVETAAAHLRRGLTDTGEEGV